MAKYRLNSAETLPNTINHVAVTKKVGNKEVVTYSNYIRLVPGKEYETEDPAMIDFFKTYRRKVRHTQTLEEELSSKGVPYDIEYCRSCGGRVKKINYQVVEVYDDVSDCDHPEFGTLIYCGSASNKAIVSISDHDPGVQDGWTDASYWVEMFYGIESGTVRATGVFDGTVVVAESISENAIAFDSGSIYLTVMVETDPETGDSSILVTELSGASHYAIYYEPI